MGSYERFRKTGPSAHDVVPSHASDGISSWRNVHDSAGALEADCLFPWSSGAFGLWCRALSQRTDREPQQAHAPTLHGRRVRLVLLQARFQGIKARAKRRVFGFQPGVQALDCRQRDAVRIHAADRLAIAGQAKAHLEVLGHPAYVQTFAGAYVVPRHDRQRQQTTQDLQTVDRSKVFLAAAAGGVGPGAPVAESCWSARASENVDTVGSSGRISGHSQYSSGVKRTDVCQLAQDRAKVKADAVIQGLDDRFDTSRENGRIDTKATVSANKELVWPRRNEVHNHRPASCASRPNSCAAFVCRGGSKSRRRCASS